MICPRVPVAQIAPVANAGEYPRLSIEGKDNKPMVTTVAPTIPVLAASNIPTNTTDTAMPLRYLPSSAAMATNRDSATLDFSNMTPMNTNNGTAISVSLETIPNNRLGMAVRYDASNPPTKAPIPANIKDTPASVNATG